MTDVAERPETLTRAALAFRPESLNREAGTVEVTLSTGAPVRRGGYIERLAISREAVTYSNRIPVLDSHRQTSIGDVLGRVLDVRFEADRIDATLRISNPATLDAIERGDLTGISIGYRVDKWSESPAAPGVARTRTATAWTLLEASLVPIPADPSAFIRSDIMSTQVVEPEAPAVQTPPAVQTDTRAAINAQIRSLAEVAGLDRTFADAQIDAEATVESARAAAFEAMATRGAQNAQIRAHVGVDHTEPAIILERQAEALAQRMGGPEASGAARQYVGLSFADHARAILQRAGERTDSLSAETLLTRAMMTTSDFPLLMEQGGTRVLSTAYQAAESPLKQIATRREVTDLRDVTVVKSGELSGLEEVTESGEVKHGSFGEGAESYQVKTFAKIFSLSRKVIINDQFGVFGDMMRQMGQLAAAAEANTLIGLLTQGSGAGPLMSDDVRLFHADHGNVASVDTVGVPSLEGIGEARLALRSQKGLDGVTPIGVTPKWLVVGPENETLAEMLLAQVHATKAEDQNVFAGKLDLIVEPRLGSAWYVFGDKVTAPVLEMAYLSSAPGPQIQTRDGWDTLGREYRVVLDLGVGAVDYRGAFRNAG
ncbi:prohead protease/major capsid protein fusion protein [Brevundimonas sp. VNH65]|uniref:prohead protease/major capsid protein fusion protein n=1 Tax=Brevundimonas sp. VNH65 TaxID=3400917 RepID=UPI003C0E41FA